MSQPENQNREWTPELLEKLDAFMATLTNHGVKDVYVVGAEQATKHPIEEVRENIRAANPENE